MWRFYEKNTPQDLGSVLLGKPCGVGSSLVEYVEKVEGLSLEDVRRIAPKWYLRQLKLEATPLKPAFRKNLAEVLKQELENPRYRLKKRRGKIIGRWPEL